MIPSRRDLPALSGLLALEAVERLGTATAAADELHLTPGAISRALAEVEATLGQPLFHRDRQRLHLTAHARAYVAEVRRALGLLGGAGARLRRGGAGLALAILPAFGMHWLAPRLTGFRKGHPDIAFTLSTRLRPFELAADGFDAAIHYGRPDWPNADHLLLMEETVQAVCAPDFLPAPLTAPDQITAHPLLMIEGRAGDWGRWLAALGVAGERPTGMMFDQFATMQQAAIHGLGLALLPGFLAADDLAAGRLVPAFGPPVRSRGSYYLVWPQTPAPSAALTAFISWIKAAVAAGSPL